MGVLDFFGGSGSSGSSDSSGGGFNAEGLVDLGLGLFGIDTAKEEAKKNRRFQRSMRNTAYQAAARDLDAAGLNRILALGSPAATPSGSMPNIPKLDAVSTGIAASSAKQQIAQSKAKEALDRAQEELTRHQTKLVGEQTRSANAQADKDEVMKGFFESLQPLADAAGEYLQGVTSSGAADVANGNFGDAILKMFSEATKGVQSTPTTQPTPPNQSARGRYENRKRRNSNEK